MLSHCAHCNFTRYLHFSIVSVFFISRFDIWHTIPRGRRVIGDGSPEASAEGNCPHALSGDYYSYASQRGCPSGPSPSSNGVKNPVGDCPFMGLSPSHYCSFLRGQSREGTVPGNPLLHSIRRFGIPDKDFSIFRIRCSPVGVLSSALIEQHQHKLSQKPTKPCIVTKVLVLALFCFFLAFCHT